MILYLLLQLSETIINAPIRWGVTRNPPAQIIGLHQVRHNMNKPFGAQGEIVNFPFKDLHGTFYNEKGVEIAVKGGVLFVGVDDEAQLDQAKEIAQLYIASWAVGNDFKITVEFNHEWKRNTQGNKDHFINVSDHIKAIDRVQIQSTTYTISVPMSYTIAPPRDSASFTNFTVQVQKAQKYPALKSALLYYSQEVVDDERPLYGIYKALEAMTAYLSTNEKEGRNKLAHLAGQSLSYVDDVMQTTQVKRHHKTAARRKLSDKECRQRAKILINAFANSLL